MEGHWRAFLEGIGGALVGIGGHWRALEGIGGDRWTPASHAALEWPKGAKRIYPTDAGGLEARATFQQRRSHVDYSWQTDRKCGQI